MNSEVTLAAVEQFVGAKHKGLRFPAWLEARFESDTRRRRSQIRRAAMVPNLIVYNLFLVADWFLIPDEFYLVVLLHAFVVSPWIVLVGWLAREESPRLLREGATASVPVVIVLQILTIFMLTRSPDASHYQYFVLIVLLFTNTIQRLPYAYAVVVSVLIIALHAVAVAINAKISGLIGASATVTLSAAAYLTLTSNYHLERDARRAYLYALRERLRHAETDAAAKRDALTELGNRHLLATRTTQLWADAGDDASAAVIMLDIDHFKLFNDRYGHVAGDLTLKRVAACVSAELRHRNDTAIRYGGEELLVLLPNSDLSDAVRVAERIRRSVEALAIPHEGLSGRRIVTASLGAAAACPRSIAASELIAAADAALYASKRNGRNQVWPPLLRQSDADAPPHSTVVPLARK